MSHAGPVLAAVDFSAHSEAALLWAAEAARRFQVPLLVLHVIHDPEDAPGTYSSSGGETVRRMEEVGEEMMVEFIGSVRKKHPDLGDLRSVLTKGLPATRILEVAEREGAQLLVLGSRGRTKLANILLGSKVERVVQLSPVPVTIVKATK